jgi:hypothetical protein
MILNASLTIMISSSVGRTITFILDDGSVIIPS